MTALVAGAWFEPAMAASVQSQDLIVIAAPTVEDAVNAEETKIFKNLVDFDIAYANAVYGRDQVLLIVDEATLPYFEGEVPESIVVVADPLHVWMRDFTTINPHRPVQFRYTPASFEQDQNEADGIQDEFNQLLRAAGYRFPKARKGAADLKLDGGNIVDNYAGRVITTERFLSDNQLSKAEGIAILERELNANEVAIIPADDPWLAHSDGMVMFSDENTLFVNRYDEPLRSQVLDELRRAFPAVKLVEIEAQWSEQAMSACGINLNATVTSNFIYMPHFDDKASDRALEVIQQHTQKKVIPIPALGVCELGGSVRCLSWQQSGPGVPALIRALRETSL